MRQFTVENGFRPQHRAQASEGYWGAFSSKLRWPLGPRDRAVEFIAANLDPEHALSAVDHDGTFLGVAGYKTRDGAFLGGGWPELRSAYGALGAAWRATLISTLERDCEDGTLLMDGIFVTPKARGRGVGTQLLSAIEQKGAELGLVRIRLDVIDTNPRARNLYEREGYKADGTTELGPLRHVFGFASATTMHKVVGGVCTDAPDRA